MAVTPRASDDPHTHPNDATQVFTRPHQGQEPASYGDRPPHAPDRNPEALHDHARSGPAPVDAADGQDHGRRGALPLDATLVMPRRERPAWRGVEPAEAARQSRQARRLRNQKIASMVFAATGLLVVTSGAWAVLGSGPGDPTFAGAVPTLPAAEASTSAGPAAVAPLQPLDTDTSETWHSETVTPSGTPFSIASPRTKRRTPSSGAPSASTQASAGASSRKSRTAGRAPHDAKPLAARASAAVTIESPQNGDTVDESVTVTGEAEVPEGHQVYLLTGSAQEATTCQGESTFICGPATLTGDEETIPLAVIVAPAGNPADPAARDEVTVQHPMD